MDEYWQKVIIELEALSQQTGVKLPDDFKPVEEGKPAGRLQADPWMRNNLLLDRLAGFLQAVTRAPARQQSAAQAAAGDERHVAGIGPEVRRGREQRKD